MAGTLTQILTAMWRPFQWWVVVAPWERALRVRLGKTAIVLQPGPHFRIPFLDRVYLKSVRLRIISEDGQTMTTRDGKVVTLNIAVQYAIEDIALLYHSVANPETTLLQLAQASVAECVAETPSTNLTARLVEERISSALPNGQWGLGQVRVFVTTFAFVKTYRLLMNSYRTTSGADQIESENGA